MFPNCPGAKGDQGVQHSNHYISDLDPEIRELAMALRRKQLNFFIHLLSGRLQCCVVI